MFLASAGLLKGRMAVALHDADSWKESSVAQAADYWATFAHRQLKSGAGSAHRLAKRDEAIGFDFTTVGIRPNRSAELCRILAEGAKEWHVIWTRLGEGPFAPWRSGILASHRPYTLG